MNKPIILFVLTNTNIGKHEELSLKQEEENLKAIIKKNTFVEGVFLTNNESFEEVVNVINNQKNENWIVGIHFSGHGNHSKLFLKDETVYDKSFNKLISHIKTLKFVFLNACKTEFQGKNLERNNKNLSVIYTKKDIDDNDALKLSERFYTHLLLDKKTINVSFDNCKELYKNQKENEISNENTDKNNEARSLANKGFLISGNTDISIEQIVDNCHKIRLENVKLESNVNEVLDAMPEKFYGRKEELDKIERQINPNNNLDTKENRILISGGGGCGKTSLAIKFISKHYNEIFKVLYIDGNNIESSIKNICREDISIEDFRFVLVNAQINLCIYIDNYDDNDDFKIPRLTPKEKSKLSKSEIKKKANEIKRLQSKKNQYQKNIADFKKIVKYKYTKSNIFFLVTSRYDYNNNSLKKCGFEPEENHINLEEFKKGEAENFFYSRVKRIEPSDIGDNSKSHVEKLTNELLEGMPMAIEMASALIEKQSTITIKQFNEDFEHNNTPNQAIDILDTESREINRLNKDNNDIIRKLWRSNIELIKKDSVAEELIHTCAFLYNKNIPIDILEKVIGINHSELVSHINTLQNYSLIKASKDKGFINIHSLLQYAVRAELYENYPGINKSNIFERLKFRLWIKKTDNVLLKKFWSFTEAFNKKYAKNYFTSLEEISSYGKNFISYVDAFNAMDINLKKTPIIPIKHPTIRNYKVQNNIIHFTKTIGEKSEKFRYRKLIISMLKRAVKEGNPDALYDSSLFIFDKREKFEYIKKGAEAGHMIAQNILGLAYKNGLFVNQNDIEAFKLFKKSAMQDYYEGQYNCGRCYWEKKGVEFDGNKVLHWFRKAVKQKYAPAINHLAAFLKEGIIVEQNLKEATNLFKEGARLGDPCAQLNIGRCYENGIGVVQNENIAFDFFKSSARQGLTDAKTHLGYCYAMGKGVKPSTIKAKVWLNEAAHEGSVLAMHILGTVLKKEAIMSFQEIPNSNGGYVNMELFKESLKYFKEAAKQGHILSFYDIGVFYKSGILGVKKMLIGQAFLGIVTAYKHFPNTSESEVKNLRNQIDMNISKLESQANRGDAESNFALGIMYEHGFLNGTIDRNKAHNYYKAAYIANVKPAIFHILLLELRNQSKSTSLNYITKNHFKEKLIPEHARELDNYALHLNDQYNELIEHLSSFNNPVVKRFIGNLFSYGYGFGDTKDIVKAITYYEEAIKLGDIVPYLYLSYIYGSEAHFIDKVKSQKYAQMYQQAISVQVK